MILEDDHEISILVSLPRELIDNVVGFVRPADLLSLRLTCRILEAASFDVFGRMHTTIEYDLSRHKTELLQRFATQERLVKYVKRLRVCAGTSSTRKPLGDGYHWNRGRGISSSLSGENPIVKIIGRLLLNSFINCKALEVHGGNFAKKYSTGGSDHLTASDAVAILLRITIEMNAPVDTFAIYLDGWPKELFARQMRYWFIDIQDYGDAWKYHLRTLILRSELKSPSSMGALLFIVSTLRGLSNLSLDFDMSTVAYEFLRIAAQRSPPPLTSLSLSKLGAVSEKTLWLFLSYFQSSLKSLVMQHIYLEPPSLDSHDWRVLIKKIGAQFHVLESFAIWMVAEHTQNQRLFFCPLRTDDSTPSNMELVDSEGPDAESGLVAGVRYQGQFMRVALEKISQAATTYPTFERLANSRGVQWLDATLPNAFDDFPKGIGGVREQ